MDYKYAEDGKIHLRYSDFSRCTPGQVERLIMEHKGIIPRYESAEMEWGTTRHDMWKEESLESKMIPKVFQEAIGETHNLDFIEREFASEILPGVVIHSRPDGISVGSKIVFDWKTVKEGKTPISQVIQRYRNSKQAKFYAFQAMLNNIRITETIYGLEIWNGDQTEIIGYEIVRDKVSLMEIASLKSFVANRVSVYMAGLDRVNLK